MEKNAKRRSDKIGARKVVRIRPGTKSVVLGVTGSIAAYKSAELASLLVKQGHEVFVVMTQDATEFISSLTLQTLSKNPVIAPAMNGKMWQHPATTENVEKLKSRGVEFIGPEEGMLACGYEGLGRLWKVNDIAFRAEFLLARQDNLIA